MMREMGELGELGKLGKLGKLGNTSTSLGVSDRGDYVGAGFTTIFLVTPRCN